jgi:hypothetical protein
MHGPGDGKLPQRAVEPVEMARHVDDIAACHLADFVDAVRELVTAILHMYARVGMREIAAIHIGDTRHGMSFEAGVLLGLKAIRRIRG